MGLHANTVFKNSCLKVPVNPLNRLPSASFERVANKETECKINIESPIVHMGDEKNPISFREFYKSIPDYKDVNHLSNQEFYMKLENLRQNKYKLLMKCKNKSSCDNDEPQNYCTEFSHQISSKSPSKSRKYQSPGLKDNLKKHVEKYSSDKNISLMENSDIDSLLSIENMIKEKVKPHTKVTVDNTKNCDFNEMYRKDTFPANKFSINEDSLSHSKSWSKDLNSPSKFSISKPKDEQLNPSNCYDSYCDNFSKRSYSVPTSPIKKSFSPQANITIPQPFKMSERDNVHKILKEMKDFSKELENNFLQEDQKKTFKANPVPIESRILLYDKILEDQELRRSISKLQSAAELQAQMKPFKFTVREEKYGNLGGSECRRLCRSNPQLTLGSSSNESEIFKSKKFKAKPVPRNLFSNYVYDRMREDEFYRALNRRIRAEEMLKAASLPPSMAKREKSHKKSSTSKCTKNHHFESSSDSNSMDRLRQTQNVKIRNKYIQNKSTRENKLDQELENLKDELISPASKSGKIRKTEQMDEIKKIYGSNSSEPTTSSSSANNSRSALDFVNRSNLAAILRIESSKKKLEADILKRLEEERYQSEIKWRDSVLRRKPAWKSIKYSHAEDLAMRLQMRRDEERLKREQFLHEMELMYGRVHRQPMMFERFYSPRKGKNRLSFSKVFDNAKSIEKPKSALTKHALNTNVISPNRSRKVSINEMAETICDEIDDYSYKDNFEEDMSKSTSEISESIPEQLQEEIK